ncbi:protein kinase C zeta type-like [Hyla sarda]|uniref:protein kinase C zeta type-like n=1 Tax=Hyla sarda TaxID=327740 RepID=UPI0024C40A47|nr:protein kinase C zeta type-like [Hyla sarda]
MACGLQFLHEDKIIHQDLIVLDAEGHVRIMDLGLAQDGVTLSTNINGAPLWKELGVALDWLSLGTVFRMAEEHFPFYNVSVKHLVYKAMTT